METDFTLDIRTEPRLLRPLRWFLRTYLIDAGYTPDRSEELILAIDEACTNAMRHAYGGRRDASLRLALRSSDAWLEVEVADSGKTLDPSVLAACLAAQKANELKPGGLGLILMHRVFDEVTIDAVPGGGNCFIMRARREEPTQETKNASTA